MYALVWGFGRRLSALLVHSPQPHGEAYLWYVRVGPWSLCSQALLLPLWCPSHAGAMSHSGSLQRPCHLVAEQEHTHARSRGDVANRHREGAECKARGGRLLAFVRNPPPPSRSGPKAPWALGFGLTFPNPKRALGAHGVPHWGSSAPAHHTHPLAMQPVGGAHASSSSIVACVLSAGRGEGGPPVRGTVGAPAPLVL